MYQICALTESSISGFDALWAKQRSNVSVALKMYFGGFETSFTESSVIFNMMF